MVNLDKCSGTWNALDGLSSRVYVMNKTKDVNLNVLIW